MKVELTEILLTGNGGNFMFSFNTASINLSVLNKRAELYFPTQDIVVGV